MESDPLAQLRDIRLPTDILWWPLAPGWWILITLSALAIGWLSLSLTTRYRSRLYRRQALAQLNRIELGEDNQLVDIFETLKQTANIAYPNQHFSSLGIAKFIEFLKNSCNIAVFDDLPNDLGPALYSPHSPDKKILCLKVLTSAKIWVAKHELGAQPRC